MSKKPWKILGHVISYCLVQPVEESCQLQFSRLFIIVVIVSNLIKFMVMVAILLKAKDPTLLTIGDCITSHLQRPEPKSVGMCLLDKYLVKDGQWKSLNRPQKWDASRRRWFAAASVKRWIVWIVMQVVSSHTFSTEKSTDSSSEVHPVLCLHP